MYAKLSFASGTTTGEAVRDIVRLITDSNTSAGASLDNLEFITVASSTLHEGTASGWDLHSSSNSLPADGTAVSASDSTYILQGTCETGSKAKHCAISVNGSFTSSSVWNGTTFAIHVANVLDPGESTEMYGSGYHATTSSKGDCHGVMPTSAIHVWADPRRIILHGTDGNSKKALIAHMESAETPSTTAFTLPPVAVYFTTQSGFNVGTTTNEAVSYRGDGNSLWDDQTSSVDFISFTGSMYMHASGKEGVIRSVGWHRIGGYLSSYNDGTGSGTGWSNRNDARSDDGTQYGSLFTPINPYQDDSNYGVDWLIPNGFLWWGPANCHTNWDNGTDYDINFGRADAQAYDSSGNLGVPKFPLVWFNSVVFNTEVYDFASKSHIYRAPAGLGATGDTVTIGSDTFQYVSMGTGPLEAFLIKRT